MKNLFNRRVPRIVILSGMAAAVCSAQEISRSRLVRKACASCHDTSVAQAPRLEVLRGMSPEKVVESLLYGRCVRRGRSCAGRSGALLPGSWRARTSGPRSSRFDFVLMRQGSFTSLFPKWILPTELEWLGGGRGESKVSIPGSRWAGGRGCPQVEAQMGIRLAACLPHVLSASDRRRTGFHRRYGPQSLRLGRGKRLRLLGVRTKRGRPGRRFRGPAARLRPSTLRGVFRGCSRERLLRRCRNGPAAVENQSG